jgi:hypothetical protein
MNAMKVSIMPFKPGYSGNPKGRVPGSIDRRSIFRDMVAPHGKELVETAVQLAKSGNEQMLRLLLDRLLPAKPKDDIMPAINIDSSLPEAVGNIFKALSNGEITPIEANEILTAVKSIELVSLEERLHQIEEMIKK